MGIMGEYSQILWNIGTAVLLMCILILLYIIFRKSRFRGRRLEDLVQERTAELDDQNMLMYMINNAAAFLLESDPGDFYIAMNRGMEVLAQCVDADRVIVWRNSTKNDGRLYYKQAFKLTHVDFHDDDSMLEYAYQDSLPRWESMLSNEETINGPVEQLPNAEQKFLELSQIQSILAIPIFLKGDLWGYISFEDCQNKRTFPEGVVNILRSWGLLVVAAVQRDELAFNMHNALTKLEAVTNNYKGIVWSIDKDGIITTFSGQYLRKLNVNSEDLEGTRLESARIKYKLLDIVDNINKKTFAEGPQDWISDIDSNIFQSYSTPMFDGDGKTTGVIGSTDDVTEMVKLQRALETALEAAEAASHAKSAFLANMSHEIRTPMNAIIGMITIGKNAVDPARKDYCFAKIEDASRHLLGVINDILDMSKIEANKFELSISEFNFESMLQRVANVINFRVDERNQKFTVHIDEKIPKTLVGDDQRLAQVITNLLGNAVKFTPPEGSISFKATFLGENNGVCTIKAEVTDTGIGISAEQQSRLFQSFSQAETSTSRKFGGTGLGLSISKNIIEMMNGKIWIESDLNKGATFAFTIDALTGADHSAYVNCTDCGNVHMLAIDGDNDVLDYFRETSARFGTVCTTAGTCDEARKLAENNYNICFVDWKSQGSDGIRFAKDIKSLYPGCVTVLMISSTEWSNVEDEIKKAGINRLLPKPLFPSAIAEIINETVNINIDDDISDLDNFDMDYFRGYSILVAEDIEINREIVMTLLEELTIDCAVNGIEAVQMFSDNADKYDVVFMDVQMPEMDGYEATRRIRELDIPKAKTIPILAMTANVFTEDVEKCIESGMNDHIGKPLDLSEVLEKLRKYLPQKNPV